MIDGGLHAEFRKHLPRVHWQRVENSVGNGVPDVNYCVDGKEGWIEYKVSRGWRIRLRPGQVGWLEQRTRYGGRVCLAVRRKAKGGVDQLWLLSPLAGAKLLSCGLNELPPGLIWGIWEGGPSSWPWDRVLGILIK